MRWFRATGLRLLLALGLSFALWVFVSFSENPDQSTSFDDVPVGVQQLAPGLVIVDTNGLPRTSLPAVDITVQADSQTLARVQSSNIRAFVDLTDVEAGEHVLPVIATADRSDLNSLTFPVISPRNVAVRLEQVVTRTVDIEVNVQGNLPFSFERGTPQVLQDSQIITQTQITGPAGRVDQVSMVSATADIEQLRADYTASVSLQPMDENGVAVQGVTVLPDTVSVRVPIRSVAGLRRVAVIGQVTGIPAPGYVVSTITSAPQLVNLTGSSGPLDAVNEIQTDPIDIAGATGTISREVNLRLPIGTSLQVGEPTRAVVTVQVIPLSRPFTIRYPVPLQVTNVANGLIYALTAPTVEVTLTGSDTALGRLGNTPLQGTVDVSGLGAGAHTVAPTIALPDGVRVVGAVPNATVTLRAAATAVPLPSRTDAPQPSSATPQPTNATPEAPPTATSEPPTATEDAPNASARPTAPPDVAATVVSPLPTPSLAATTFPPASPAATVTATSVIQ